MRVGSFELVRLRRELSAGADETDSSRKRPRLGASVWTRFGPAGWLLDGC